MHSFARVLACCPFFVGLFAFQTLRTLRTPIAEATLRLRTEAMMHTVFLVAVASRGEGLSSAICPSSCACLVRSVLPSLWKIHRQSRRAAAAVEGGHMENQDILYAVQSDVTNMVGDMESLRPACTCIASQGATADHAAPCFVSPFPAFVCRSTTKTCDNE